VKKLVSKFRQRRIQRISIFWEKDKRGKRTIDHIQSQQKGLLGMWWEIRWKIGSLYLSDLNVRMVWILSVTIFLETNHVIVLSYCYIYIPIWWMWAYCNKLPKKETPIQKSSLNSIRKEKGFHLNETDYLIQDISILQPLHCIPLVDERLFYVFVHQLIQSISFQDEARTTKFLLEQNFS